MTSEWLLRTVGRRAVVCCLGVLFACGVAQPSDQFKAFNLKTTDGTSRSLKDYLNKATLVTFFFPTCGYCNAEFPLLEKIYDAHRDRGLSMIAINIVPDQISQIPEWQSKHGYTFPVLVGASIESAHRDYGLTMTPTHFLLDGKGKVLFKQTGFTAGDEKILEAQILKALD